MYQIVYVSDQGGTNMRFYVNGTPEGGDHVGNVWSPAYSNLKTRYIGQYRYIGASSRFFNGEIPLAGGTMTGAIAFAGGQTWPTFNQSTTGNAATATKLATARTINGVPFDGTANVTVTAQPAFVQQHSDNTSNGTPFVAGVEYSLRVNGTYSRSTPVSPAIGDKFILNNLYNTWDSGLFTLTRGSSAHKINNIQEDVLFNANARRVELTYIYANEWIMAIS